MKKAALLFISIFLIINSPSSIYSQNLVSKIKQDIFTLAADSMLGREAGSIELRKSENYIINRINELGIAIASGCFEKCGGGEEYRNIYAVIEGNDPVLKDEYIVLGAHYDHLGYKVVAGDTIVYNGADDNASGVACLLEIMRMMKENNTSWKRSIVFAFFDAEENGLNGSTEMANEGFTFNHKKIETQHFKMMMSLDMVGWLKASQELKITGIAMLENGESYFENIVLKGGPVSLKGLDNSFFTGSDHIPFAQKRVPALHVTTGIKSPYHKPEDDADLIDLVGIKSVADYLYSVTDNMANSATLSASGKIAQGHKTGNRSYWGINFGMGSNQYRYSKGTMHGKTALSVGVGILVKARLSDYLSLRSGINYYYSGGNRYEGATRENILSVPLLLAVDAVSIVEFSLGIGPYYDWCFANKLKIGDVAQKNILNQHDVGLMGMASIKTGRLILGVEVKGGFLDLQPGNVHGKSYRVNSMFKIGFTF